MARWEQDFDFYLATIQEQRASFMLDLAASQHAPVATHPLLLSVRVAMHVKRDDGLRHESEMEVLGQLEEQFCAALEQKVDAIYVGRVVHGGYTTMFFYVPVAHRAAVDQLPAVTGEPLGDYLPQWSVAEDAEWKHYLGFMAPGEYAYQTIWNRRLVTSFAEKGDSLSTERPIDHVAFFATRAQADGAAAALRNAGFTTDDVDDPDDNRGWSLEFHRAEALHGDHPDEFVAEVLHLLGPFEGDYDGWGAELRVPSGQN